MPTITNFHPGARCETLGVTESTTTAATVTASGTANAKGAWTSLGQTTMEWRSMLLCVAQTAASNKAIDVGLSTDGTNFGIVVPDLIFQGLKNADQIGIYSLPLRVPLGAFVGVRCAASTASHVLNVSASGSTRGINGSEGYSMAVALFTPTLSRGVAIDPGGTANIKGAWTQLIASSPVEVDAISIMIGQAGDVNRTNNATALLDIGLGASGSEAVIIPNLFLRWTTTLDGPFLTGEVILPISIPSGSRLAARGQCTDVTAGDRTFDVSIHGWVP
jgi:hypothetical protein